VTTASRRAVDELAARSAAGEWFVIDHAIGGLRPAAHIFACREGIAFADGGWEDPNTIGQHTMHVIKCKVGAAAGGRFAVDGPDGHTRILPLDAELSRRLHLPDGPLDQGPRELARHHCGDLCTGIGP